eukprot:TRINITY_DN47042_c0_g2_i1.p1 TRINITY_DN47042_c0_g2~~TRINITY_DN47042_c0_g2_i1.p1  ORF type:complete len:516 (+),score=130.87 TRINITY_DN47042_c0_g2_i1:303-1850(+)
MALYVKAFLEKDGDVKGEIRRFTIPSTSKDLYNRLHKKVAEVFNFSENGFELYWQDTDGDFVTFSSSVEMMEAVHHSTDGVLRVFVKRTEAGQNTATGGDTDGEKEKGGEEPKVHHPGVVCDGCETAIYGPRYKCVICPDYDLCSTCEQKGVHSQHDKFKITHPQTGGGPEGFMPPHFRRWMHRFMKKCPAGFSAFRAGREGATCGGEPAGSTCGGGEEPSGTGTKSEPGSSSSYSTSSSSSYSASGDEFLNNMGANIAAFLDPFGVDVSYEVRHGDGDKKKGHFRQSADGQFSSSGFGPGGTFQQGADGQSSSSGFGPGGPFQQSAGGQFSSAGFGPGMPGMFHCSGMFGNAGGCTRMPQGATPAGSTAQGEKTAEKPAEEKPQEKPSSTEQTAAGEEKDAEEEEETVIMEEKAPTPKAQDTPRSKEASPTRSHDEDWTMLNDGETVTDGEVASAPREGLYPNLKVTQSVEMMKAMGFNDDAGWLTRLLETTDGDIAQALDTLKLGAQQASKLA